MSNNSWRFRTGKYYGLYYFAENNLCKRDYKKFAFVVTLSGGYVDSGYQAEFECEGTADKWDIYDEWDIYESIADYFDVVGDFNCDVRWSGRKILIKGTCVFPLGEPVKGIHNIPLWIDVE
ncbi:hypothetical protein [Escherichia coli]|uniref:hypothetical protein n=1 Tax=Escherichia coli TaxID=562 RepID=UPI00203E5BB8|nr:hypothetical protein [Escherichia coli]